MHSTHHLLLLYYLPNTYKCSTSPSNIFKANSSSSFKPHHHHQHFHLRFSMAAKNMAQSAMERNGLGYLDQKLAVAKRCSHEAVLAGAKAAVVATVASAIPTLASVRMLPWAKAHLNPTAQALIISTVAGAAYFIVADKTVVALARKNSFNQYPNKDV